MKELVLAAPDLNKKMRMKVNVLDYAIKEVLSMECKDRQWRLVTYLSKSLIRWKETMRSITKRY